MAKTKRTSRSHVPIAETLVHAAEQISEQKAMLFGLRQQLGVTQEELADLLEISLPSVSRYEREGKMMPMKVAHRLAELAWKCGDKRRSQWFRNYISFVVKEHSGFDEKELLPVDGSIQQLATAVEEVLRLDWKVNPALEAVANQEVRQRAMRLWGKLQALIFGHDPDEENG